MNFCRRPVGQDVFLKHFWDCYKTFQQTSTEEAGMPAYFRFLTLLGELNGHGSLSTSLPQNPVLRTCWPCFVLDAGSSILCMMGTGSALPVVQLSEDPGNAPTVEKAGQ